MEKISYEPVDDKSLSCAITENLTEKRIRAQIG